MENTNEVKGETQIIEDSISEAYNDLYKCLKSPSIDYILSKNDADETLRSMLEHFTITEEYEKCALICQILKKYE
jgi:hypothetical protein